MNIINLEGGGLSLQSPLPGSAPGSSFSCGGREEVEHLGREEGGGEA